MSQTFQEWWDGTDCAMWSSSGCEHGGNCDACKAISGHAWTAAQAAAPSDLVECASCGGDGKHRHNGVAVDCATCKGIGKLARVQAAAPFPATAKVEMPEDCGDCPTVGERTQGTCVWRTSASCKVRLWDHYAKGV